MNWQVNLLDAASDMQITQQEVTGIAEGVINAAIQGMIIVSMMSVFVKLFYDIIGKKKLIKQEEEVLGMVRKIW